MSESRINTIENKPQDPETTPISKAKHRSLIYWLSWTIFCITTFLLLFLIAVYTLVGDRIPYGEYFTIWPSLVWCYGLIPCAILSWNRKARWRFVVLVSGIIVFLLLTVEWASLLRREDKTLRTQFETFRKTPATMPESPISIRLVTWNINSCWSGGKEVFLRALEPLEPDMCFFQETPDGTASIQPEDLIDYWMDWHWIDNGDCGILSRFPLHAVESERIGPWEKPQLVIVELPNGKNIIAANVRLMLPALIINPLTESNRNLLIETHAARVAQFPALTALLRRVMTENNTATAILAGDFNTHGTSQSLAPLRNLFTDVWSVVGLGWGATMTSNWPVSRIDQCWITKNITPVSARVVSGTPSDHNLLLVDLIIEFNPE